jgi:site-specific DNA-methyltransferase (adenine-specific)
MQHEGWAIVMGDCLDVLRTLPAVSADVVPTSPPYNQAAAYHQHNDRMPRGTYLAWIEEVFVATYRVLKDEGSFFLNINGSGTAEDPTLPYAIIERALAAGFVLQNEIVWIKVDKVEDVLTGQFKPVTSRRYLDRAHERILHLTKSGDVVIDRLAIGVPFADKSNINRRKHAQDRRCGTNVWFIPYETVQSKAQKFNHPAGFPVELPTRCIKLHGVRPGLLVVDPFLGAGTTLVAAQTLGCRSIGIEIDPKYVEVSIRRLAAKGNESA